MSGAIANLAGVQKAQSEEVAAVKAIAEGATASLDEKVAEQFKAKIDDLPKGFVASQASDNVDGTKVKEGSEDDFFKLLVGQTQQQMGFAQPLVAIPQAVQGAQGGNN